MSGPQPRPGILDIAPYVPGDSKAEGHKEPIKLASNESSLGPSPRAVAAYKTMAESLHRYPDGASADLRKALARHHGLDAERIVCGNGSDELIGLLTKAYAGQGDEVLFTEHGFAMYPIATLAAGAKPVVAKEKGLRADVAALLAKVTDRTRIVFLANPNNPTGSYLTKDEVEAIHRGLPERVLFVIDAAYAEYVSRNDYTSGMELAAKATNVVMTRTFSKIYGLAGVRLGWMYGPTAVVDAINRIRGPFNVTLPAQAAGVAALADVAHIDQARTLNDHWLPWFSAECAKLGLEVPPSVGNFVLVRFPKEKGKDANAANEFLLKRGIILRKVAGYGLPEYLRVTIGNEAEMRATAAALADFVKS
ncbi:MAG: histidinol-phosphate transaminase [Rhodospirillaceae bacterium]|nr:histidinol-phosphate transaminase [Rhodospirillaceae bacterium]